MNEGLIHKDEVYALVGAAMEVHRELGGGFLEAVYQEAMEIEMEMRGILFVRQVELGIRYKDRILNKKYCADFICYGNVLVEIKAQSELTKKDESQLINYLNATGLRVGLLINFGDPGRLDWKRLIH